MVITVLLLLLLSFGSLGLAESDIMNNPDVYPAFSVNPIGLYSGDLASSLYTFQDHACAGTTLTVRCPRGSTISIQFGVWGRQQPSSQMCPMVLPELPEALLPEPDPSPAPEDINCLSDRSMLVILRECQDRRRCHLKAISETFSDDPCPATNKYLEVAHKCKPDEFHTHLSCEGQDMVLVCPKKNTRIAVYSARFGRSVSGETQNACPNSEPVYRDCFDRSAYEAVLNRCHGRHTCTITADLATFGDPCPSPTIRKYLHVVYSCVPKKILKVLKLEPSLEGRTAGSMDYANDPRVDPELERLPVHSESPSLYEVPEKETKKSELDESDSKVEVNSTVVPSAEATCNDTDATFVVGMVTSWVSTVNFLKGNGERVVLYLVLGFCGGLLCLLILIIFKIIIHHKKRAKQVDEVEDDLALSNQPTLSRTLSRGGTIERDTIDRGTCTVPRRVVFDDSEAAFEALDTLMFDAQLRLPNGRASRTLTHYYA